jgi:Domain of unknown function (DUF4411)
LDLKNNKSGADPFLISAAVIHDCIVVTEEKFQNNNENKPRIPNVCKNLGIKCINLLDMLREEGLKV